MSAMTILMSMVKNCVVMNTQIRHTKPTNNNPRRFGIHFEREEDKKKRKKKGREEEEKKWQGRKEGIGNWNWEREGRIRKKNRNRTTAERGRELFSLILKNKNKMELLLPFWKSQISIQEMDPKHSLIGRTFYGFNIYSSLPPHYFKLDTQVRAFQRSKTFDFISILLQLCVG